MEFRGSLYVPGCLPTVGDFCILTSFEDPSATIIPRRCAAAPGGTGEGIPPHGFVVPLLSAFGLRV